MVQTRSAREAEAEQQAVSMEKTPQEGAGVVRQRQVEGTASKAKDEVAATAGKVFNKAQAAKEELPPMNRVLQAVLCGLLLSIIHFAIDAGLQHRLIEEPGWRKMREDATRSLPSKSCHHATVPLPLHKLITCQVFAALYYLLHRHADTEVVVIGVPTAYQATIRKALFFTLAVA